MDWICRRRIRRELERMRAIASRIERYLKLELELIGYVRRCRSNEELRPFKLRKNCIPLKGLNFCVDPSTKKVYVTFIDTDYRCYVISFLNDSYFKKFVERLCDLYSTSCLVYSFCSCS